MADQRNLAEQLLDLAREDFNAAKALNEAEGVSASKSGFNAQQGVEKAELRNPAIPKVLFKPISSGGWNVEPWHTRPSQVAHCAGLHATYTGSGALIPR